MSIGAKSQPNRVPGPWLFFLGFSVSVSGIASWLAHIPHVRLVALAASMDLILTVPIVWYLLMVRPGLRSKASMVFIGLLGLWRASFLFPDVVPGKLLIGAGIEFMIVVSLVVSLRGARQLTAFRDADPIDRFRQALQRLLYPETRCANSAPVGISVKAVASELSVGYYAFGWKARPHVPPGNRAFSLHQRGGSNLLIGCLCVVSLMEMVLVHLAVHRRSPGVAWILTAVSLWGALWMLALSRSFRLRPTLVHRDGMVVRFGLLCRLIIPAEKILCIEPGASAPKGTWIVPRSTSPSVCVRFTEPLEIEFLAGITKRVEAIAISADDDTAFQDALTLLARTRQ